MNNLLFNQTVDFGIEKNIFASSKPDDISLTNTFKDKLKSNYSDEKEFGFIVFETVLEFTVPIEEKKLFNVLQIVEGIFSFFELRSLR